MDENDETMKIFGVIKLSKTKDTLELNIHCNEKQLRPLEGATSVS